MGEEGESFDSDHSDGEASKIDDLKRELAQLENPFHAHPEPGKVGGGIWTAEGPGKGKFDSTTANGTTQYPTGCSSVPVSWPGFGETPRKMQYMGGFIGATLNKETNTISVEVDTFVVDTTDILPMVPTYKGIPGKRRVVQPGEVIKCGYMFCEISVGEGYYLFKHKKEIENGFIIICNDPECAGEAVKLVKASEL